MPESKSQSEQLIISFLSIRKAIGILGIALPFALLFGSVLIDNCDQIQGSISAYYYTEVRNIFVGILCAVSFYLFSYNGYDKKDRVLSALCGLSSLGVAFLPTSVDPPLSNCVTQLIEDSMVSNFHFLFAGLFFSLSAYISIQQFTLGRPKPTLKKLQRNRVYKWCGYIMILCLILIGLYTTILHERFPELQVFKPIFWLETIALWAYGTSWLVKGEALLADE